jgi:putative protease
MADRLSEVRNQDFGLLRFSTESTREAEEIIQKYLTGTGAPTEEHYTRGLYYRGIE